MTELTDGMVITDPLGREATIFKPKWYRIDRWLWWIFICGDDFSKHQCSIIDLIDPATDSDHNYKKERFVRAYVDKDE